MKILLIDDDSDVLDVLSAFFKSMQYDVEIFTSYLLAKDSLYSMEYDLVLLDIILPDFDGIKALKDIKQIDKNLPVVIMTGYKDADRVVEAYRSGASDVLLKPFNFDYIKNNILAELPIRHK